MMLNKIKEYFQDKKNQKVFEVEEGWYNIMIDQQIYHVYAEDYQDLYDIVVQIHFDNWFGLEDEKKAYKPSNERITGFTTLNITMDTFKYIKEQVKENEEAI